MECIENFFVYVGIVGNICLIVYLVYYFQVGILGGGLCMPETIIYIGFKVLIHSKLDIHVLTMTSITSLYNHATIRYV